MQIDWNTLKPVDQKDLEIPAEKLAPKLLGKVLETKVHYVVLGEIEAYNATAGDEACHAYRKVTDRNRSLSFAAGYLYVYLIYGIHYCANITSGHKGQPQGCLIRGGLVFDKKIKDAKGKYFDGPAKLTKYLNIDRRFDGIHLYDNNCGFKLWDAGIKPEFIATKRIGISKSKDRLWRFLATIS